MAMLIPIFLLLAALDLWSAWYVAGIVGALITFGLLVVIPLMLSALLRRARLTLMAPAAHDAVEAGPPAARLTESALLVLAGFVVFFPGFVSDILAALLLVPALRRRASRLLLAKLKSLNIRADGFSSVHVWTSAGSPFEGAETAPRPMKYVRNEAARS